MTGKVYLTKAVNESLPSLDLSAEQVQDLDAALTALSQGEKVDSSVVLDDGTPSGGLRALDRKNLRILYRLDPNNGNVMVADIRPISYTTASAVQAENELSPSS